MKTASVTAAIIAALSLTGCYGAAPETTGDYLEEPTCKVRLGRDRIVCPSETPYAVCFYADPDLEPEPAVCFDGHLRTCQTFSDHGEVRGTNVCCSTPDCL